jgi:hypothetical protein
MAELAGAAAMQSDRPLSSLFREVPQAESLSNYYPIVDVLKVGLKAAGAAVVT